MTKMTTMTDTELLAIAGEIPRSFPQPPRLLTGLIVLQVELGDAVQWVLATDPTLARQHIEALGGVVLAVLDPAAVVREQYRGVALLGDLG